ncbi:hypothetical protein TrCOL_g11421 [Triparma columacea]|uniref:Uncharacterized protein n=1 Tax=Triparma columacea TaxID=722753 RepID=A0A9W7LFE1_9STRA|nr:hypothetical protein TrCOL_g11421 [Triparma columacea]
MSSFEIPPQLRAELDKLPITRQPSSYKSRVKTDAQLAKSSGSLPPPPASNIEVMTERFADSLTKELGDDDFHQRLLQFATDSTFGLRLQSKGSGEEFLKLFKAEHRKYMKGMKKGDIEKFLERRENSFGR